MIESICDFVHTVIMAQCLENFMTLPPGSNIYFSKDLLIPLLSS